jgi:hypothetical protein
MKRTLFLLAVVVLVLATCGTPAYAHVIKPVYANTCTANWKTIAGNEKQIRCFASYFGVDPNKAVSVASCESGLRWNATSASGTYRGTWQYGPVWEDILPHYLPQHPNESPYHGRRATIVTMRYVRHLGNWSPWSCA